MKAGDKPSDAMFSGLLPASLLLNMRIILVALSFLFTLFNLSAQNAQTAVVCALDSLSIGKPAVAYAMLLKSANTNNIYAQYYVAKCKENGIGTEINPADAFYMYRKAAERGLPYAMLDLSRCYQNGIGIAKSEEKASTWRERYSQKANNLSAIPDIVEIFASAKIPDTVTANANESYAANPPAARISEPAYSRSEQPAVRETAAINGSKEPEPKSDVDINIPVTGLRNENTFALIIANENYHDVAKVDHAINDGAIFARYCHDVLGLPESNVHFVKDATLNNIKREIRLLQQIADAYNGQATFIVYYAGHGIPDEQTHKAYLLPIDGYTADISTCYGIDELYNLLGKLPAAKVVVFMDACFSGATRGSGMLASARGISIKSKSGVPTGNTIVIASAQGDETAYPYEEQQHGMFTYFLLKKLNESNGQVTLGNLVDYIVDNVKKKSIVINGKSQTPTAISSDKVLNDWQNWTIH
ncbi:MAG: hypothetical protein HDR87_09220 [Bacteroides sp.]|nr:hypothetical protein [Bacteroides sp.]